MCNCNSATAARIILHNYYDDAMTLNCIIFISCLLPNPKFYVSQGLLNMSKFSVLAEGQHDIMQDSTTINRLNTVKQ